jgi:dihydroflavonol-4-reductase
MFIMMAQEFSKKAPSKRVTPFIATLTWRLENIKSKFTGITPLLTKETANTALTKVKYDNRKLLNLLPGFKYTPISQSVKEICSALMQKI